MRIAILGGTGELGEGLALRLARDTGHEVVVGSRDADRAVETAEEYTERLSKRGEAGTVDGASNSAAVAGSEIVVLSVPPKYARRTLEAVADDLAEGATIVSPAVPMVPDEDGFRHDPPRTAPSLTALIARSAPESTTVVGAFHSVPAARLADLDAELGYDVPVVGRDAQARITIVELTSRLQGLRGLEAGGLDCAVAVEWLTPLLLNVARFGAVEDVGPSFH